MDTYTVDIVYQAISALFQGTNPKEQEKANKWLQEFQKSVSFSLRRVGYLLLYIQMKHYTN